MVGADIIQHDDHCIKFTNGEFYINTENLSPVTCQIIAMGDSVKIYNRFTKNVAEIYKHIGDDNYYVILIEDQKFRKHWPLHIVFSKNEN